MLRTQVHATNHSLEQIADFAQALADPTRLRILLALKSQPLCACQIVALIGLANSTVSRHLQVLRQAGLITSEKRGRWVWFRLVRSADRRTSNALLALASSTPEANADASALEAILAVDPEVLCQRGVSPHPLRKRVSE